LLQLQWIILKKKFEAYSDCQRIATKHQAQELQALQPRLFKLPVELSGLQRVVFDSFLSVSMYITQMKALL